MSSFALGQPQNHAVSNPGAAATILYPALVDYGHTIESIAWSLSDGTSLLTIEFGDELVFAIQVTGSGRVPVQVRSPAGVLVRVRLGVAGGENVGRLNIIGKGLTPGGDRLDSQVLQMSNSPIYLPTSPAAPPAPSGNGDFRWIDTSTRIEYEWDATLARWVEFRPVTLGAVATASVTATGGVGIFNTLPAINAEVVFSTFRVSGSGIATVSDYYEFFPRVFRSGSGSFVDVTDYKVNNLSFPDVLNNVTERTDRKLFAFDSMPTFFTVRANKVGNAANFGNATFALQVHRVRAPA